jgi:quinol monooxygenase YgiN
MNPAYVAGSEPLALVVRFHLRPGHEREFDDLVASTVASIAQHEPGTVLYVSHQVEGQPMLRIFYELYENRAAFEAHEHQPYVRHFLAERDRLVERVEVDWLTSVNVADARGGVA